MIYPTANELDAFLTSVGIAHGGWSMPAARQAGIDRWEDLTDWRPFFAGEAADVYYPLSGVRRFAIPRTGLISFSSLELGGVTLAADQYILKPLSAPRSQIIDLLDYQDAYLMIRDAVLGYTDSLTQDQYDTILILMAMTAVSMHTAGGLSSLTNAQGPKLKEKVGPVERWYQDAQTSGLLKTVEAQAELQAWAPRVLGMASCLRRKAVA